MCPEHSPYGTGFKTESQGKVRAMHILMTGSTGFIGGCLLRKLLKLGIEVTSVCRHRSTIDPALIFHPSAHWVCTKDEFSRLFEPSRPYDATVHLATSYGDHGLNLSDVVESNILLPVKVFEAALETGCRILINTDTFSSHPRHAYAHMGDYQLSKRQMAEWGKLLVEVHPDICFYNVRLEHVYGPEDSGRKFVPFLVDSLLREVQRIPLTKGEQQRDFIHVDDVCAAYILLLRQTNAGFHEVGVGTGSAIPLRRFIEACKTLTKSNSLLDFGALEYREREIMHSAADPRFLLNLGWKAGMSLEDGIQSVIAYRRERLSRTDACHGLA
jgi:nucleoside-diphosphate-sugar epimerase